MFEIDWKNKKIWRKSPYLNRKQFFVVAILILLTPFIYHADLLIKGEVTKCRKIGTFENNRTAIFAFYHDNVKYEAIGPIDVPIDFRDKQKVLYDPDEPEYNLILHPASFYVNYRGLLVIFMLAFWTIVYFLKRNPLKKYHTVLLIITIGQWNCTPHPVPFTDLELEQKRLVNFTTFTELNKHFLAFQSAIQNHDSAYSWKKAEDILYITDAFLDKQYLDSINPRCERFLDLSFEEQQEAFNQITAYIQQFNALYSVHYPVQLYFGDCQSIVFDKSPVDCSRD